MRLSRHLALVARTVAQAAAKAGWSRRRARRTVERALFAAVSEYLRARVEGEVARRRNP